MYQTEAKFKYFHQKSTVMLKKLKLKKARKVSDISEANEFSKSANFNLKL
jgi:hypothetical protein